MKRISVYLLRPIDSPYFHAQWVVPDTARRKTKSLKTADARRADVARADLEAELNRGAEEEAARPRAKREKPRAGYAYVVESAGLYKIGKATDVTTRVAGLHTDSPHGARLVLAIRSDDARWLEAKLHKHHEARWVRGEWFALTADDLARLAGIDVWDKDRPPCKLVEVPDPFAS